MKENVVLGPNGEPLLKVGVIRDYSPVKLFGFIKEDDGSLVYFHQIGLVDNVKPGDRVTFHLRENGRGGMAVNIKRY